MPGRKRGRCGEEETGRRETERTHRRGGTRSWVEGSFRQLECDRQRRSHRTERVQAGRVRRLTGLQ